MKAAFYTLGCKVNQYETNAVAEMFRKAGYDIVPPTDAADVYVVNTCVVTQEAEKKSRNYIRRAIKRNPDAVVCVTGCYAQTEKDKALSMEGVDIVLGTDEKSRILEEVQRVISERSAAGSQTGDDHGDAANGTQVTHGSCDASGNARASSGNGDSSGGAFALVKPYEELTEYEDLGIVTDTGDRTRAFVKVQEGCDRFCSYCIIPFARGKVRSRDKTEIVEEVKEIIGLGCKEIVLTGINTALYGTDLGYGGIEPLIADLNDLDGDFRIRLSSLEPTVIDADYAAGLLKYERLCHHLHLSLQSGSDSVLARMNRRYTGDDYKRIVDALRDKDPDYGISADVIVGFPGETDSDFEDSVKLVEYSGLVRTHVFKYSRRKGTPAAEYPDQIAEEVKKERSAALIEAAEKVGRDFVRSCSGTSERVLVEQQEGKYLTGYTGNYIKAFLKSDDDVGADGGSADISVKATLKTAHAGQPEAGEFRDVEVGEPYLDGAFVKGN